MQTDKQTKPSNETIARRLAKELNANGWQAGRAFYVNSQKWTGARTRNGNLEISMCNRNWTPVSIDANFDDGNGNRISVRRLS